jgi:hypothetical protein
VPPSPRPVLLSASSSPRARPANAQGIRTVPFWLSAIAPFMCWRPSCRNCGCVGHRAPNVDVGHRANGFSCRLSKPPRPGEVLPKFCTYSPGDSCRIGISHSN